PRQRRPALQAPHVGWVRDPRPAVRARRRIVAAGHVPLRDRGRRQVFVGLFHAWQVRAAPEADQVLWLHPDGAVGTGQDGHIVLRDGPEAPVARPSGGLSQSSALCPRPSIWPGQGKCGGDAPTYLTCRHPARYETGQRLLAVTGVATAWT